MKLFVFLFFPILEMLRYLRSPTPSHASQYLDCDFIQCRADESIFVFFIFVPEKNPNMGLKFRLGLGLGLCILSV